MENCSFVTNNESKLQQIYRYIHAQNELAKLHKPSLFPLMIWFLGSLLFWGFQNDNSTII